MAVHFDPLIDQACVAPFIDFASFRTCATHFLSSLTPRIREQVVWHRTETGFHYCLHPDVDTGEISEQ